MMNSSTGSILMNVASNTGIQITSNSTILKNLATPTSALDAATKSYVDTKFASVSVPTNVSTFTNDAGYLTLADLPIYDGSVS